jgi:hypothetical protein
MSAVTLSETADVLRSEWCKFRSVRSTLWTLIAAMVSNVLLAALAAIFIPGISARPTGPPPTRSGSALPGCTFPRSPSACSTPS